MMIKLLLPKIDLFGTPIEMNFAKKTKIHSDFGGICSLIYFSFIIWAAINASKDLFSQKNPKTISSESHKNNPRELVLTPDTFPIAFGLQTPDILGYTAYIDESIYTIQIYHIRVEKITLENGTTIRNVLSTQVPIEICTPAHFGKLISNFDQVEFNNLYCVAQTDFSAKGISIQGAYVSEIYELLNVQVLPCNNITSLVTCASQDKIDMYLSGGWFNALYTNMVVDPNNYSHPDSRYREIYGTMIHPLNYKQANIALGYLEVTTDSGWVFENTEIATFIKTAAASETLQLQAHPEKILITCSFEVGSIETYYSRVYKKVPDVLAEIGGFSSTAFVILLALASPYSNIKFREALMNDLFDIKLSDKSRRKRRSKARETTKKLNKINEAQKSDEKVVESNGDVHSEINDHDLKLGSFFTNLSLSSILFNKRKINTSESPKKQSGNKKNIQNAKSPEIIPSHLNEVIKFNTNNFDQGMNMTNAEDAIRDNSYPNDHRVINKHQLLITPQKSMELDRTNIKHLSFISSSNFQQDEKSIGNENKSPLENIINLKENKTLGEEIEKESPILPKKVNFRTENDIDIKMDEEKSNFDEEELSDDSEIDKLEPQKLTFTFWEYMFSFLYKSKRVKEKLQLLEEGVQNVDERLNVINMLQKLREVDKLKALILDDHERILFNNLPKPEIKLRRSINRSAKILGQRKVFKRTTFIERSATHDQVAEALHNIRSRPQRTPIDDRMLEIFNDRNS